MAELILALDLPSARAALAMVDRLAGLRWVKVGPILMTREGPSTVHALRERGLQVFLDLKWHDIPNTVAGAVSAAVDLGVALATVHTLGGPQMMEAAARAAAGRTRLVGVTVLTSHDDDSFGAVLGRGRVHIEAEVVRLARAAVQSGLDGVVCSPREVGVLRQQLGPEPWLVVPGIRQPGDPAGDQSRTATASEAVAAGATHLVVGRPILESSDPAESYHRILESMA
ncbi:MAG: orotidine-5'-phosphate decarboxylase [Gemmatimonadota bacterium]